MLRISTNTTFVVCQTLIFIRSCNALRCKIRVKCQNAELLFRLYFLVIGLTTNIYSTNLRIQSEKVKIQNSIWTLKILWKFVKPKGFSENYCKDFVHCQINYYLSVNFLQKRALLTDLRTTKLEKLGYQKFFCLFCL